MVDLKVPYNRDTELRCVQPNDIYKLAVILDESDGWKKLMEIIPKDAHNKNFHAHKYSDKFDKLNAIALKYNNDQVRLLEDAAKRSKETRLFSQILFDEWGTSGRKNQRPTLGVILKLLVKAQQFRAADFVTENLLKETPLQRPGIGPAAKVDISLPSDIFHDIENVISDGHFNPNTVNLNQNQQLLADNNIDFYTKYHQFVNKQIRMNDNIIPKPPPRLQKLAKLKSKKRRKQQPQELPNENEETLRKVRNTIDNIPEVSALMNCVQSINLEFSNNADLINLTQVTIMSSSLDNNSFSIMNLLNQNNASGEVDISENKKHTNTNLPFLSVLNLDRIGENSVSKNINANGELSPTRQISYTNNNGHTQDVPMEVTNVNYNCNQNNEKDNDDSIPNLSIFQRITSSKSDLRNLTAENSENSFDFSLNNNYYNSFHNISNIYPNA